MKIAVLSSPESWYVRDLQRAAGTAHQVVPVPFSELAASIEPDRTGMSVGTIDLRMVDLVLVRTMPPGSLEQVVFRMDILQRLEAAGLPVVNPARAIEAAVDKYLASAKLQAAGLLTPETIVCQTVPEAMRAFDRLGGDVVIKPLFGSEGRGLMRASDPSLALRAFKTLVSLQAVLYLQRFIPHDGFDLRLLVIGTQVLGIRRRNLHDWRTNVSRGAVAEPFEVDRHLAELALIAAGAVGASLAGVDLLPGCDGLIYAIEVNAVPGWKALAGALDIDVARLVIDHLATKRRKAAAL